MHLAFCSIIVFIFVCSNQGHQTMKVAIIGAGPSGLISAKYCADAGFDYDIYEQTGAVGGTWVYTDKTDLDENDLPVHSSMYKNLRTNLPKELMTFGGFTYPEELKRSYLYQAEVLQYFENFTKHFHIDEHIKFFSYVKQIESLTNGKWLVKLLDVKSKTETEHIYNVVMVCNGHYEKPFIPDIKGASGFEGMKLHSHAYRIAEIFTGKTVLIIGGGPSGIDISRLLSKVALKVFLSHRNVIPIKLPNSVYLKPIVKEIFKNSVVFNDGTEENIDVILYCTGYEYSYPFLSKNSDIEIVNGKWVRPLYKQIVNIEHPTMAFIGIPFAVAAIPVLEVQVRFFISSLTGHFQIPSKENMLKDFQEYVTDKKSKSMYPNYMHKMGNYLEQEKYFNDLTTTANITRVPNVVNKLYKAVKDMRNLDACYKIVDSETFEKN
ncbi:dimethylaniline monooxygenase [N-oxide-forming] 3 isoform X2 [Agrilus planipennis]|uniref:Flavin-containing monooxygenase n=1 Tax=Agrilus planipennis TaxID=224129 RepID=A0A1W4WJL6_AGRPL|nr:dimethylaniline monooxygenase [N-oxide-forming] 3 isoform X2 [Agrilus planipennis]